MLGKICAHLNQELQNLEESKLYKHEHAIITPQRTDIVIEPNKHVLNFCANNYLGLADNQELIHAAQYALKKYGYGMASVRFICGTQDIHLELEAEIAKFLNKQAAILYSCCFDANTGLFETLLGKEDAIISDELNHASIIDGVRLCKAQRYRYKNNNMEDLRSQLEAADAANARFKMIATDGVFSMDGVIANLKSICDLADQYDAMVMVDDSHAVGFVGENGRGTPEYCGVEDRVDIITGTLGKALGGASGGYTAATKPIIEWLRNRSRPYLFSNSLAPVIVATSLKLFDLLRKSDHDFRRQLQSNALYFRRGMEQLGFELVPGEHPIIPVMLYDAKMASNMASQLLQEGVYVVGFSYPVVPMGKARIRLQMSAAHTKEQLDYAIAAFAKVGKTLEVIK